MKEFKGTLGPWHIVDGGFDRRKNTNKVQVYATNEDLEMICQVWKDGLLHNKNQDHLANAKLIAAAPLLLEALQSIENDDNSIPTTIWKMRNDAIKKALL